MRRGPYTYLTALLAALLVSVCSAQDCDTANGWYGNEGLGACYLLGELTDPGAVHPELTWFESVKYCEDQIPGRSFLATIRNQAITFKGLWCRFPNVTIKREIILQTSFYISLSNL